MQDTESTHAQKGDWRQVLHSHTCVTEFVGCMQATELPVLDEDRQLDADSCNSGEQQFEKLTAGLYMGDIARRIMLRFRSLCCMKHEGADRTILTCRNALQSCRHLPYEDLQSNHFSASVVRAVAAIRKATGQEHAHGEIQLLFVA